MDIDKEIIHWRAFLIFDPTVSSLCPDVTSASQRSGANNPRRTVLVNRNRTICNMNLLIV
jgi:hypothetical protein